MNIVFWSNANGKYGTTSNLMAVATITSIVYDLKTIVLNANKNERIWTKNFSTDINDNADNVAMFKEDFAYYNSYGVDNIIDELRIRNDMTNIVRENMVKVRNTGIFYIPPSKRNETGLYTKEIENVIPEIMRTSEKLSDVTFIDVKHGRNKLTDMILECADVIVVNMRADEKYFPADYLSEKLRKKCIVSMIQEKYQFKKAVDEGQLIEFLTEGIHLVKEDENFAFIRDLFESANEILRKAGYDV